MGGLTPSSRSSRRPRGSSLDFAEAKSAQADRSIDRLRDASEQRPLVRSASCSAGNAGRGGVLERYSRGTPKPSPLQLKQSFFAPMEVVTHEGAKGTEMFFITRGMVQVTG